MGILWLTLDRRGANNINLAKRSETLLRQRKAYKLHRNTHKKMVSSAWRFLLCVVLLLCLKACAAQRDDISPEEYGQIEDDLDWAGVCSKGNDCIESIVGAEFDRRKKAAADAAAAAAAAGDGGDGGGGGGSVKTPKQRFGKGKDRPNFIFKAKESAIDYNNLASGVLDSLLLSSPGR